MVLERDYGFPIVPWLGVQLTWTPPFSFFSSLMVPDTTTQFHGPSLAIATISLKCLRHCANQCSLSYLSHPNASSRETFSNSGITAHHSTCYQQWWLCYHFATEQQKSVPDLFLKMTLCSNKGDKPIPVCLAVSLVVVLKAPCPEKVLSFRQM